MTLERRLYATKSCSEKIVRPVSTTRLSLRRLHDKSASEAKGLPWPMEMACNWKMGGGLKFRPRKRTKDLKPFSHSAHPPPQLCRQASWRRWPYPAIRPSLLPPRTPFFTAFLTAFLLSLLPSFWPCHLPSWKPSDETLSRNWELYMGFLSLFPPQCLRSVCLIAGAEIGVVFHAKRRFGKFNERASLLRFLRL